MAHVIPERMKKEATAGEQLLFRTLKSYLPEEYIVYYEPDIRGWRPDFVVIGPDLGVVVLEVKDYTRKTLDRINPDQWTLRTSSGKMETVTSPLKQARDYAFRIADLLRRDLGLVQTEGKHKMRLKFPYGYGTVLTRLTKAQLAEEGLYAVLDPKLVLTREEIDPENERFSAILLRKKLKEMFTVSFPMERHLSALDIQRIRFHLFPEVRIGATVKKVPFQEYILLSLDDLETMDLHQENLAKQIGDKHRLIRGVAGSGKTLILASRARLLAKAHPGWNILVLCFNISLSRGIRRMIDSKFQQSETAINGVAADSIRVRYFHEWLRRDLRMRESRIPEMLAHPEKLKTCPTYDAILIDEGQDFKPEWLGLASKLLNPDTQSFLIVEDRAQNIYARKRSYRQDTGLDFRGRSRILTVNYRNTAPIVDFSWNFYQAHTDVGEKTTAKDQGEIEIISPQSSPRKGPVPEVRRFTTLQGEMDYVAGKIHTLRREQRIPLSEILILYRVKQFGNIRTIDAIRKALAGRGIPYSWIAENEQTKRNFRPEESTVKISTIDSSKGLDYQAVFVVNVDRLPLPVEENQEREVSLLYIAMTRAKEYLVLTYSGDSEFTRYFDRYRGKQEKLLMDK
ncbi:3'-5' exonuclease [Paludifilum halophilum]|uniref:Nuclease n=1 Tax=Paludifilum halophilum TaxID=1642702 RepID=A0A235B899_9BACL|nr:nuclease-related domain-containing DEAD/DEAH box helicase [Paludifilum halophilum]OYD08481.1 nuclease [Paludifilum halophilum]